MPTIELPDLEFLSEAPFVRRRRRSSPIWVGLKFIVGLGLGFFAGCLIAALLAPAAGEDARQAIRDRLPGGGPPPLPDAVAARSGSVTRGAHVSTIAAGGGLARRFEAAKSAMAAERREHENALFARFRRALATGRASEL